MHSTDAVVWQPAPAGNLRHGRSALDIGARADRRRWPGSAPPLTACRPRRQPSVSVARSQRAVGRSRPVALRVLLASCQPATPPARLRCGRVCPLGRVVDAMIVLTIVVATVESATRANSSAAAAARALRERVRVQATVLRDGIPSLWRLNGSCRVTSCSLRQGVSPRPTAQFSTPRTASSARRC